MNDLSLRSELGAIAQSIERSPNPEKSQKPDIQKCLGIVKKQRKQEQKLIIAPFPEKNEAQTSFSSNLLLNDP
ncbi:MAG: hypothetical protein QNJ65_06755 [Xenococcaceae cyanobacterium MO_234.B1]|nr:hypothetical protein [Xenococcaceae cyanobacterium MO_234.B1]